jgi:hypothetical protein
VLVCTVLFSVPVVLMIVAAVVAAVIEAKYPDADVGE